MSDNPKLLLVTLGAKIRELMRRHEELKERAEKGGGEQAIRRHWGELQQMERGISEHYERLREGCK